ncbi:MAG: hypothetical protein PHE79_01885 [Eubacteriales bacterium]|nr:hypothetical protein [Eubacteriales bacterium]
MEKQIDITNRFSSEIGDIAYILQGLKTGRIYGYNGNCSKSDGSLETNVEKLEKAISELIHKIEYGKDSDSEKLAKAFYLHNTDDK